MTTVSFDIVGIVTIVGVFVSFVTFYYQRRQDKFNALLEAFNLLNNEKHRVARRVVYYFYEGGKERIGSLALLDLGFPEDTSKGIIINEYKAIVRNDFNQIGSLIENKLLPKDAFMDTYWYTILRCWIALKGDIVEQRKSGGNPSYMKNFEHLNDLADQYREHKYPEIKPKFPNKTQ